MSDEAHPSDAGDKVVIAELNQPIKELVGTIPAAYLPNYELTITLDPIAESDVWLNRLLRAFEASGCSGFKAAINGVPSLSVADGWGIEGCIEGLTG